MTRQDLNNSRRFDVHTWSSHPESNIFVDALWPLIEHRLKAPSQNGRKQKAPNKKQFKVLLLDLYLCWTEDPFQSLGVPMTNSGYKQSSIYNALHISPKTIQIIRALHCEGLIDWHKGSEITRKTTRIWPTETLISYFEKAKLPPDEVIKHYNQEVIVLNAKVVKQTDTPEEWVTKSIEYDDSDNPKIEKWRVDLQAYNELLDATYVDVGSLQDPWVLKKVNTRSGLKTQKVRIDQNHKFVRRIFYRGSWELGGRFHGGFWQQIGSDIRKDILINEHRSVEIDYKGMHVSIACALEDYELKGDPYVVPLMLPGFTEAEQREVVKGLVLMAINAETLKKAYTAFRGEQERGSKAKKLKNVQLQALLDQVTAKVPILEGYIGKDKGVELMSIDGEITSKVINHFTAKMVPILSVHDSYIVQAGKDHELIETMNKAASEVLGRKINLEADGVGLGSIQATNNLDPSDRLASFRRLETLQTAESETLRTSGYNQRVQSWINKMDKDIG